LDTLRADNVRLRRLLQLSEEQARAAASDQATLTGAPDSPVTMGSSSADKVRFFFELFRCRTDVYALRWENRRDGRSGWMPAIKGYWRKGMNRADAPYLPLTPEVIDAHLRGEAHIGIYRSAMTTRPGGSRRISTKKPDARRRFQGIDATPLLIEECCDGSIGVGVEEAVVLGAGPAGTACGGCR
jgi:hypothetical protein